MELDPLKVRPRDGWVVVLAEPRKKEMESGIILAPNETGAEIVSEGAGKVVRVGPGEKNEKLGITKDARVLYRGFLKHANPIEVDEKWPDGQNKKYFIMSSDDVLGFIPDGVQIGVYSGRPQVPEKKK